jgi:hypothetical protein
MKLLQALVLVGGPGLVLGAGVGALVPRWRPLVLVAPLSAVAFWYGITHAPEGSADDDDDPVVLVLFAMVTNFAGWLAGLVAGAGIVRARRAQVSSR